MADPETGVTRDQTKADPNYIDRGQGPARAGVNLRKCVTPSQNRVTEHATAALVHAIQSDRKYYTEKDTLRVVLFVRHEKLYALMHSAFRKSELFLSVR